MDQAHFAKTGLLALIEIFFDDAGYFLGLKRMKIEMIFEGNDNGLVEWRFGLAHFAHSRRLVAGRAWIYGALALPENTAAKITTAAMPVGKDGMNANKVAAAKSSHSTKLVRT